MDRTATWRKSTFSSQDNGCIEVNQLPDGRTRIRDTKLADGPVIEFTRDQWDAWLDEVASDELTGTNGAVTVLAERGTWTVRNTPSGPTLTFNATEWHAFRDGVHAGEFSHTTALAVSPY